MAYVAGSANSFADLLTALQNACLGNGWALNGNVLSKGGCFVEAIVVSQTYPALRVQGGTGIDGSNALTGRSDVDGAQIGLVATTNGQPSVLANVPFTFPMDYEVHIHASPDEVYLVVHYGISFYQMLAFGRSAQAGLAGSGNWFVGTDTASNRAVYTASVTTTGVDMRATATTACGGLFMGLQGKAASQNGGVHHALDSATWAVEGAWRDWATHYFNSPNAWNGETPLSPVRVYASRPSGFISQVLECAHARFVNIANLNDGQIITLGTDKWKVYPWWARGTKGNTVSSGNTYTGVAGHALRYDGP